MQPLQTVSFPSFADAGRRRVMGERISGHCRSIAGRTAAGTLLLFMFAAVLPGQEYRGRIQGTVHDTSDAVIAGATVTLLNVNTGISAVRQSNETGHYLFDLVEPGSYSITVQSAGFTKFVQSNVPLAARGYVTVDTTLKPGDV